MKKIISSLTLVAASITGQMASAGTYWGVGVSDYEMEVSAPGATIAADARPIEGLIGVNTSPNLAWEGRFGLALGDKALITSINGESIDIGVKNKVNYYLSAYVRPQININIFNLYGLLGYTHLSNTVKGGPISTTDTTDNGLSYGAGVGVAVSDKSSINLEWKNLCEIEDGDVKGFTLGYRYTF